MIEIEIIPILSDNYAYILKNADKIAIVDPGEAAPILSYFKENNLTPDYIINTHHHWDHTGGNEEISKVFEVQVVAPIKEQDKIDHIDIGLKDQDVFTFGDKNMLAIETPGHTQGHLCLWCEESKILLSGDMVFAMGCGRPFEGSAKDLYESFQKLAFLPDDAQIYCGHEYTLTNARFAVGIIPENAVIQKRLEQVKSMRDHGQITIPTSMRAERQTNPFLLAQSLEEFEAFREKRNQF